METWNNGTSISGKKGTSDNSGKREIGKIMGYSVRDASHGEISLSAAILEYEKGVRSSHAQPLRDEMRTDG